VQKTRRRFRWIMIVLGLLWIWLIVANFPYATGAVSLSPENQQRVAFYERVYGADSAVAENAANAITGLHIREHLRDFIVQHDLQSKKVLDVGAGQGLLQDMVDDYTGFDVAASAKHYFHKPYLSDPAGHLPFPDGQFDVVWSIFDLQRSHWPEYTLGQMRHVTKDGGYIYLYPSWSCGPWAADGYEVRPYSDFGVAEEFVKASISIRSANLYRAAYTAPTRLLRFAAYSISKPTALHYSRLTPNYETYWTGDSDAASSIDRYEALLWFASRGDECLNCSRSPFRSITERVTDPRLIIRVHKK
jgi:hypothetical protein